MLPAGIEVLKDRRQTGRQQVNSGQRKNSLGACAQERIGELARESRVPSMCPFSIYPASGGLLAYGPNLPGMWRQLAGYVDRVLKGAKPGDLPIERPSKFEFVINLKTAKALGLTIPPSLLARADQIIE